MHPGEIGLSNDTVKILNLTDKLAQKRGDQYIASELFILGALDLKCALGDILKQAGANREAIEKAVDELRGDIPRGESVLAELTEIADARARHLSSLTAAESALNEVLDERELLDTDARRLAAEIEAATTNLRRLAVEAFITGGDTGSLEYLVAVGSASDFAWRQYLVRSHAGPQRMNAWRRSAYEVHSSDWLERQLPSRANVRGASCWNKSDE